MENTNLYLSHRKQDYQESLRYSSWSISCLICLYFYNGFSKLVMDMWSLSSWSSNFLFFNSANWRNNSLTCICMFIIVSWHVNFVIFLYISCITSSWTSFFKEKPHISFLHEHVLFCVTIFSNYDYSTIQNN